MKSKLVSSSVRIIGGQWRGRRITFHALPGLRPTSDRIRETLFNWLAPVIQDKRCLDCFAGSGALGFEALSRGAASVDLIDHDFQVLNDLKSTQQQLACQTANLHRGKVPSKPPVLTGPYDIVFIDPPFADTLIIPTCEWLIASGLLQNEALLYLEYARGDKLIDLPPQLHCVKEKSTGKVSYALYEYRPD